MATALLLRQPPTNYFHQKQRSFGRGLKAPDVHYEDIYRTHVVCWEISRKGMHLQFVVMVNPSDDGVDPDEYDISTIKNHDGESFDGSQWAMSKQVQDGDRHHLLETGTVATIRSNRLLERRYKNQRRKGNSKKTEVRSDFQEGAMCLFNAGKRKLNLNFKRLSATEEKELLSSVEDIMRLEETRDTMKKASGRNPTSSELSKAIGTDLWTLRSWIKTGWSGRDALLSNSMGLVRAIALGQEGKGIATEDLIQAGVISLLQGIKKFDRSRGYRLSMYSYWWIRDGVTKAVTRYSRQIRLPRHVYRTISRVQKANKQEKSGRASNQDEVAGSLGLSVEKLSMILHASREPISLEQPIRPGSYIPYLHLIVDHGAGSSTKVLLREFLHNKITELISSVTLREAEVLRYRYGFDIGRMMTLDDIGSIYKVSKQRVWQIESTALDKLKQRYRLDDLKHFLSENHG